MTGGRIVAILEGEAEQAQRSGDESEEMDLDVARSEESSSSSSEEEEWGVTFTVQLCLG